VTEDEKAVAKVVEEVMAKRRAGDARGASEFFTEDAVITYHWGAQNEVRKAEGKNAIYVLFSSAGTQKIDYEDYAITRIEGDRAEVVGRTRNYSTSGALNFVRVSKLASKLRRTDGRWRYYESVVVDSTLTRM
jgi:hypothetical protein